MSKLISKSLLDDLSQKAQNSERLRMNHNLHANLEDPVQRLLNALEPRTIIPIHRHLHTDEVYILLRGAINVKIFDKEKNVKEEHILNHSLSNYGIQILAGEWHSLEVLEQESVIFEVKQGPYSPLSPIDILE